MSSSAIPLPESRHQKQQREGAERDGERRMVEILLVCGANAARREIRPCHAGVVHAVYRRAHDDRAACFFPERRERLAMPADMHNNPLPHDLLIEPGKLLPVSCRSRPRATTL